MAEGEFMVNEMWVLTSLPQESKTANGEESATCDSSQMLGLIMGSMLTETDSGMPDDTEGNVDKDLLLL